MNSFSGVEKNAEGYHNVNTLLLISALIIDMQPLQEIELLKKQLLIFAKCQKVSH
jgi:hypothetical protein